MDAQQEHDRAMLEQDEIKPASKAKLEAALKAKNGPSGEPRRPRRIVWSDPIADAMQRNPGLTREEAEEMAAAFGF